MIIFAGRVQPERRPAGRHRRHCGDRGAGRSGSAGLLTHPLRQEELAVVDGPCSHCWVRDEYFLIVINGEKSVFLLKISFFI